MSIKLSVVYDLLYGNMGSIRLLLLMLSRLQFDRIILSIGLVQVPKHISMSVNLQATRGAPVTLLHKRRPVGHLRFDDYRLPTARLTGISNLFSALLRVVYVIGSYLIGSPTAQIRRVHQRTSLGLELLTTEALFEHLEVDTVDLD